MEFAHLQDKSDSSPEKLLRDLHLHHYLKREARSPKTTIAILEERFEGMKQQMAAMLVNGDLQHTIMKT
jgi:hypothetical protein